MLIRFMSKVEKTESCWNWKASKHLFGYGWFRFEGKTTTAHRVSYILHKGTIPKGAHILHSCDNPRCVNPKHLRIGTNSDNREDCVRKNRQTKGSKNGGAKLNEDSVISIRLEYNRNKATQRSLARKYKVSLTLINRIVNKKIWRHI